MSYLPCGINLSGKTILLIGGGEIASEKMEKLIQFSPMKVNVITREISKGLQNLLRVNDILFLKEFEEADLNDVDIVIVAIDDKVRQREIYDICRNKKILCNCVDLLDCCDFIFNAFVKKDDVIISISTNGKVPGLSAVLKKHIEQNLPKNLTEIFDELLQMRKSLKPGKERMQKIRQRASELLELGAE